MIGALRRRLRPLAREARAFARDAQRAVGGPIDARAVVRAAADPAVWAVGLIRARLGLRAALGTSLGTSLALKLVFHVDVWTDAIGPGLRLPHPFGVVLGDGAQIGADCTILHNVTVQRGPTVIGDGVVLANGATVLAGADIGAGALIGAHSVVRGDVPAHAVAVGAPARVTRTRSPAPS